MRDALIDVHVHLYPDKEAGQLAKDRYEIWEYGQDPGIRWAEMGGDLDDLAATYGRAGFDRAVVVHLFDTALAREEATGRAAPGQDPAVVAGEVERAVGEALLASNDWVTGVAASQPGVEVLVTVDPTVLAPDVLVAHLTDLAERGVLGVKLHPVSQGYLPDDPRLHAIYQTCADAGLIVLSHSGPGHRGDASARPSEFAAVAERWPELKLVLAHLGGASWPEAEELAAAYPHVVWDLSEIIEWTGAEHAPSAEDLTGVIRRIGADRIMLGSDFPWYDPAGTADRVMGLPGLGADERAAILGGTALRVFGL